MHRTPPAENLTRGRHPLPGPSSLIPLPVFRSPFSTAPSGCLWAWFPAWRGRFFFSANSSFCRFCFQPSCDFCRKSYQNRTWSRSALLEGRRLPAEVVELRGVNAERTRIVACFSPWLVRFGDGDDFRDVLLLFEAGRNEMTARCNGKNRDWGTRSSGSRSDTRRCNLGRPGPRLD